MQLIKNISQSEINSRILIYLRPDIKISSDHRTLRDGDSRRTGSRLEVNRKYSVYGGATGSDWFPGVKPEVPEIYRKWNFTKTQQSTFKFSKVQSSESRRLVSVGSPRDFDGPMSDRYLRRLHTINNQRSNQKYLSTILFLKNINLKVEMLTQ